MLSRVARPRPSTSSKSALETKTEVVGPVIGADLQQKGIYATLFSILGLTAYIALRFRFIFAVGAIIATFHDIFIVFTMLAFFNYELSLNIVAAVLKSAEATVSEPANGDPA